MLHIFLADGFEEIEAFTTIDILRRLLHEDCTVSISGARQVRGAHGIKAMADHLFRSNSLAKSDCLILPGGMPGAENLKNNIILRKSIKAHFSEGKLLAAICAAPLVFGACEILEGKKATCYPGFESQLTGAQVSDEAVVVDGNIITAKGPGAAVEFAFAIARNFVDEAQIERLRRDMFL